MTCLSCGKSHHGLIVLPLYGSHGQLALYRSGTFQTVARPDGKNTGVCGMGPKQSMGVGKHFD